MGVTVEIYVGKDSADYIEAVSRLRIQIFKEYPYLYEGELDYERRYMQGYTSDDKAMIAIARVDGILAGVSTGIPLVSDSEIVSDAKKVFSQENIDIGDFYYYGEVIVLPEFRGQGITTKLYSSQNDLIKTWGFKHVCILTVLIYEHHPLKPLTYRSPDGMWQHLGFFRNKLSVDYHWPTIQPDSSVKDVSNTLEFWTMPLHSNADGDKANDGEKNVGSSSLLISTCIA